MQFVSGTHEGQAGGGGGGEGGDRDRRLSEMRERGRARRLAANLGVNFIDAERASAA